MSGYHSKANMGSDDTLPVISVNGRYITVGQLLRHALLEGRSNPLLAEVVDAELLRQHARAIGITVSAGELQQVADEMRYDRGLENADRTMEWLRTHGQTLDSLQRAIEALVIRNKVMGGIPEVDVESFYESHRDELESVALFSIRCDDEDEAAAVRRRLERGESFPVLAAAVSRDESSRGLGGFVGRRRRDELSPELADAVFRTEVGELLGPLWTGKGWNILLVADRHQPSLDEQRGAIRLLLFEVLLDDLRERAEVRFPLVETTRRAD